MNTITRPGILLASALFLCLDARAALLPRLGGAAVYDADLDITWIADANLAASNSFGLEYGIELGEFDVGSIIINTDGTMNWGGALEWIAAMNAANYLGSNNWRLPNVASECYGHLCSDSEMGHLYYTELSGEALWHFDYVEGELSGLVINDDPDLALFTNMQAGAGYIGNEADIDSAWGFWFVDGRQGTGYKDDAAAYAWAVMDGDIAAVVPIPAAAWLLLSGLVSLGAVSRQARSRRCCPKPS